MRINNDRHYVVSKYDVDWLPNVKSFEPFLVGWSKGGRGHSPRQSKLTEDELERTLRFNIRGEKRRYRLDSYLPRNGTADDYRKADREAVKAFLRAMPQLLLERGLRGRTFLAGSVYRQKKKAWQTYLVEGIYQPDDWLMAKLISSPDLEEDIWAAAGFPMI